jgi:hypothetical protein
MRCARNPPLLRAGKRRCHVHVRSLICQSMSKLLTHDEAMGGVIGRTLTILVTPIEYNPKRVAIC